MKDPLLKAAIFTCFLFSVYRLGGFVLERIPPYSVGTCFTSKAYPGLTIKITENHYFEEYSEVEVQLLSLRAKSQASFAYIRNDFKERVKCL